MSELEILNQKHSLGGAVHFYEGPGGFPTARISNEQGEALVSLHGAHVMSYIPRGQAPVIWMSEASLFAPGKPIRGGIPICWPWFGPNAENPALPGHGFARLCDWQVERTTAMPDGTTELILRLTEEVVPAEFKSQEFILRMIITVGRELVVALEITNRGNVPLKFSTALHTYFSVSEISEVTVSGLEQCRYLDKVGGGEKVQQGAIAFDGEVDRVYLDTAAPCLIEDRGMNRKIRVGKTGSKTTVVWNPWIEKAKRMPDFGDEEYHHMVCVETANAASDARILKPGATHTLKAIISVEDYN